MKSLYPPRSIFVLSYIYIYIYFLIFPKLSPDRIDPLNGVLITISFVATPTRPSVLLCHGAIAARCTGWSTIVALTPNHERPRVSPFWQRSPNRVSFIYTRRRKPIPPPEDSTTISSGIYVFLLLVNDIASQ